MTSTTSPSTAPPKADDLANNFDPPHSDDDDIPGLVNVDDSDDEDEPAPGWERPAQPDSDAHMDSPVNEPAPFPGDAAHQAREIPVEERFILAPHITSFGGRAGEALRTETPPYTGYSDLIPPSADNPWARLRPRSTGKLRRGPSCEVPPPPPPQTYWQLKE
ncbi:hypothetical protein B0H14DRAFT_2650211 [Mycena olivaceomarginata]|nr:hypothetical protein B0H14DRAFT_2650211 [Mycena olivaceomarginata]